MNERYKIFEYINNYYERNVEPCTELHKNSRQEKKRQKKYSLARNNKDYYQTFLPTLKQLFAGYYVFDMTDTDDYDCYICDVLLHKNQSILDDDIYLMEALGGQRYDLLIYLSVLAPYYYYFIIDTKYNKNLDVWTFKDIYETPGVIKQEIIGLNGLMKESGYELMSKEAASEVVADMSLEFIEKGKATVFNCIFTQIYDPDFDKDLIVF